MPFQPPDPPPPSIVSKRPEQPEEEAVFRRMRDLVIGEQNAAGIERLKNETREKLIPQGADIPYESTSDRLYGYL